MKKIRFLLLTMILMASGNLLAQNRFRVTFEVKDATCYNNGRVIFALLDENGEILDIPPPELSQVRIYYKLNETDTAHYSGWYYTGGIDSLTLNHGTYIVGVNGLLEHSGGFSTVDTQIVLTINTLYSIPAVGIVEGDAKLGSEEPGTIRSLECVDVGRVQLQITGGQFPYIVTVKEHNSGETIRTVVFNSNQYSGTKKDRYDYKDYYSIDSLPGGDWDFYVEDGCGYGLPYVSRNVGSQTLPAPSLFSIYASSGNFADSNVLRFALNYNNLYINAIKEMFSAHVQYRFTHGTNTTEWKPLEFASVLDQTGIFFDTVSTAEKYCEIWDRLITFDYKVENCGSARNNFTFSIQKPNEIYFEKEETEVTDSTRNIDNCLRQHYKHLDSHKIRYFKSGSKYDPNNRTSVLVERDYHRYHYTHPISWIYKDLTTGEIIKRDTVENISVWSSLFYDEAVNFYGPMTDSILYAYVERRLVDAKDCELYVTQDTLAYIHSKIEDCVFWTIENSVSSNCITDTRTVTVFTKTTLGLDDTVVVKLVRSPMYNRYNFEATYSPMTKTWSVHKEHISNSAVIVGAANGRNVVIQDIPLPSGPYEFEIVTHCGTVRVAKEVAFSDIYEMKLLDKPEYSIERNCGYIDVKYTKGRYERRIHNTSPESGLPTDTTTQLIGMAFDVVDAPHPSYLTISRFGSLPLGFTVSMPGRYVVKIHPFGNYDECEGDIIQYDTLYFDEFSVNFVKAIALLCDTTSTEGDVYVEAVNGTKPYTFTLYDQPNKQGNILAVNNSGTFTNIPMQSWQTLSCLVSDSCNGYFHVNIQPRMLVDLQKIWFDGGFKTLSACEGTIIQVHALNVGGIMKYAWTGPDGFSDTVAEPYVFLPRGSSNGWYKVSLQQADCGEIVSDSVFLTILEAPDIFLSPDTTVCPGETVTIHFTPQSPTASGVLTFSVAFANESGLQTRTYSSTSGVTVTDTFSTLSEAMIYPLHISDEQCDYLFSNDEDTLHIRLRDDLTSSCSLLTRHDSVCHLGTARLLASSTLPTPYNIHWFGDYGMKQHLKTETITQDSLWTSYDTAQIWQRTLLYVSVQEDGKCPSTFGIASNTMTMSEGTTELSCGQNLRLRNAIDSNASFHSDSTTHRFYTSQSNHILLKFNKLELPPTANLIIFSGTEPHPDSLLCILNSKSNKPNVIVSRGNTLSILSLGRKAVEPNWEAIVECSPGIAIADVWRKNQRTLQDRVCQSRVNTYPDPLGVIPEIVSNEEIGRAIQEAGNYYYSKTFQSSDNHGCDSVVNFNLTVDPPERHVTTVTTTNLNGDGYRWHDSVYSVGGVYARLTTLPNGCDFLDILNLTLVDASCPNPEICRGDSTTLSITVSIPDNSHIDSLLKQKVHPGDVLSTDGSILPVEKFLNSGKSPKGVVFFVDSTGIHGLAAALTNKPQHSTSNFQNILMNSFLSLGTALTDLDGETNTLDYISSSALSYSQVFGSEETDFSYCHFFNHNTLEADIEPHGWYLPSLGEICLLLSNISETNNTLQTLKSTNDKVKTIGNQLGSSTHNSYGIQWFYFRNLFSDNNTSTKKEILPIIKF